VVHPLCIAVESGKPGPATAPTCSRHRSRSGNVRERMGVGVQDGLPARCGLAGGAAKAATSISSVDSERWKLVKSPRRHGSGAGAIKIAVEPEWAESRLLLTPQYVPACAWCSPDGYDPAAFSQRPVQRARRCLGQGVPLGVEADVFQALDPHRLKRPQADVQRKRLDLDPTGRERRQHLRR